MGKKQKGWLKYTFGFVALFDISFEQQAERLKDMFRGVEEEMVRLGQVHQGQVQQLVRFGTLSSTKTMTALYDINGK